MKIFKTLEVYVLGINQSRTTVPSFSGATRLPDCRIEAIVDDYETSTSGVELASSISSGIPVLNTAGNEYDRLHPISYNTIIGMFPYYPLFPSHSVDASNFINYWADVIYNLQDYVSLPSNTTNRLWLAFANEDTYIPVCYEFYEGTNSALGAYKGWRIYGLSTSGIFRKRDDYRIYEGEFGATQIPRLLPLITSVTGGANGFQISLNVLHYSSDQWYGYIINAGDPSSSYAGVLLRTTYSQLTNLHVLEFINSLPTGYSDPYEGTSVENTGGNGTYDTSSDTITIPSIPSTNFSDVGFVRIYNPDLSELRALANYMWTDTTFLQTVVNHAKQLLENPMESVISLNMLPCAIPNGTPESVKVLFINTGVSMKPATTQFVDVDCGTYDVREHYGSALDYAPYTKIHCYLPYIGQVILDTDEVMNTTVGIKYRIDIVTGMCVAMISVDGVVMYQFSGHCAISMPLTSADFSNYISAAIQAAKIVGGVVAGAAGAGGVASALIGTSPPRSSTTTTKVTTRNQSTGRQNTAGTIATYRESSGASFGEFATKVVTNSVDMVMGSKLIVEHSGGFTGNSGYLAVRRPYLVFEIPKMCNPADYGKYNGYPSMLTLNLGECVGYTKVQDIHLTGFSATNPELSEISELLKAGVIL